MSPSVTVLRSVHQSGYGDACTGEILSNIEKVDPGQLGGRVEVNQ